MDTTPTTKIQPKLEGVGGWLAFLVFVLLVGTPLSSVLDMINTYLEAQIASSLGQAELFWDIPNIMLFVLPYLIIIAFSIYAGVALLRLRANAIKILRAYLWTRVGFAIFNLMTASQAINNDKLIRNSIYALILSAVWLLYAANSKRVANTFPSVKAQEPVTGGNP